MESRTFVTPLLPVGGNPAPDLTGDRQLGDYRGYYENAQGHQFVLFRRPEDRCAWLWGSLFGWGVAKCIQPSPDCRNFTLLGACKPHEKLSQVDIQWITACLHGCGLTGNIPSEPSEERHELGEED